MPLTSAFRSSVLGLSLLMLAGSSQALAQDEVLTFGGYGGYGHSSSFPLMVGDDFGSESCATNGVVNNNTVLPDDLRSTYRLVFLLLTRDEQLPADKLDELRDFVAAGGTLVLVIDSAGYRPSGPGDMNAIAAALNLNTRFTNQNLDEGCQTTTDINSGHPLMEGVTEIGFGWTAGITLGTGATELASGPSGQIIAAVEGNVVFLTDLNLVLRGCEYPGNNRFILNLYAWSSGGDICDMDGDGELDDACGGDDCDDCDVNAELASVDAWDDLDGDGFGNGGQDLVCALHDGVADNNDDCDDDDPDVSPDGVERCNSIDDNCDGQVDEGSAVDATLWYADSDGDGYGDAGETLSACSQPDGYVANADDCDDGRAAVSPDGVESCNDLDDDCDGTVDEDDASDAPTWYADTDGDQFGNVSQTTRACEQPSGFVADDSDCDDAEAGVNPSATEVCNSIDDDCDTVADEDDAADAATWYGDSDGDGYGLASQTTRACQRPNGFVADKRDCDDSTAQVSPAATEVCNSIDDDCDTVIDEPDAADAGTWYADTDGDDYGDLSSPTVACAAPEGFVADATDCDDATAAVSPAATEVCNSVDDDCDTVVDEDDAADASTWYADGDADGFGNSEATTTACELPEGYVADATDCDDGDAAVSPDGTEVCNSIDDDCDGELDEDDAVDALTWYADADADTFGDAAVEAQACSQPDGYVADATDCDDTAEAVYPDATELCNGLDDDCDGEIDEEGSDDPLTWFVDADGDGSGSGESSVEACAQPEGYSADADDCDDTDATVYPGATEVCDALDNDCDGLVPDDEVDADADGLSTCEGDCDDADPTDVPEDGSAPDCTPDEPIDTGVPGDTGDVEDIEGRCGCSSTSPTSGFAWLAPLFLFGLRRRR